MKIQSLAVIALLIIIPMTIILSSYSKNQIRTLQFQISYDSKLQSSTYDAIKAFQLNMSNNTMSDVANSKKRDIEAAINVFYKSLASNFNMTGYGESVLKEYVPAIVYTLYDGYYIYSPYKNTLTEDVANNLEDTTKYKNGEKIYGFKPYIYYSCRYVINGVLDVIITYSLDSYITIQGVINGNNVNESGYLLSGVDKNPAGNITYNGVEILKQENGENLQENVYNESENDKKVKVMAEILIDGISVPREVEIDWKNEGGKAKLYPQMKINGVKYYYDKDYRDEDGNIIGQVFSMVNDNKHIENTLDKSNSILYNKNGYKFYEEAYNFKNEILNGKYKSLLSLTSSDAVDIDGNKYSADVITPDIKIFDEIQNGTIEDKNSNFSMHKTEVIKNAIESNLMTAIDNYNNVSSVSTKFAMPKLTAEDWEELTNGISMVTFLQGLNIGGKIYSGYSIVNNVINDDYVSEDSIYITTGDKYYRVTDKTLDSLSDEDWNKAVGIINTDFEVKTTVDTISVVDDDGNLIHDKEGKTTSYTKDIYYYPRPEMAAYTSVVNPGSSQNAKMSVTEYLNDPNVKAKPFYTSLAQIYYTGLGRERYGMFRVGKELK